MSLTLVTGPTAEPLTLAEVRAHCRVDHALEDALLAAYILAAREYAEGYTRRALMPQTWDLKLDSTWPRYWDSASRDWCVGIELPKPPCQSVTSISYVDRDGATQALAVDQYRTLAVNGESREGLIVPAYGVSWPAPRNQLQCITVRFLAGYADASSVPLRIRQAMLLMISHWYEHREAATTDAPKEIPLGVEALLGPLRIFY